MEEMVISGAKGFHCLLSGKGEGKALLLSLQSWAKPVLKDHVLQATAAPMAGLMLPPSLPTGLLLPGGICLSYTL